MKAFVLKILRFFGVDALLLGLIEKLLLGLVKKLSSYQTGIRSLLDEIAERKAR